MPIRNIDLKFIFVRLFYPVMVCIGLTLAIPCILSRSLAPLISNLKKAFKFSLIYRKINFVHLIMLSS